MTSLLMLTLIIWLSSVFQVSPLFSHSYFPFPYWTLWKEVIIWSPHLQGGVWGSPLPWKGNTYINSLELFYLGNLPIFIIYLTIYLHQHRLVAIYFLLWVIIQYYFITFCSRCSSFGHSEFFQLTPHVFTISLSLWICFMFVVIWGFFWGGVSFFFSLSWFWFLFCFVF